MIIKLKPKTKQTIFNKQQQQQQQQKLYTYTYIYRINRSKNFCKNYRIVKKFAEYTKHDNKIET